MSCNIRDTTISLTRGDSLLATLTINNPDGTEYIPVEGDEIRFAMKAHYTDYAPILTKNIPIDTMLLRIEPEDTKHLTFGNYVYDIQLTKVTGIVDTFISKAIFQITEEVD